MVVGQSGKMKRIAIIPARGGSQRIPKKNIVDFMGKPLIAWTVESAIESKLFNKIVVSTDSIEIARVSYEYGAEIPFLRKGSSDDRSPVSAATHETLTRILDEGEVYDQVVQLMPVCPLRDAVDIINHVEFFQMSKTNYLLSCYEMTWANPWWSFKLDGNKPAEVFPGAIKKRSQDLETLYSPTGAIWMANVKPFLNTKTFYGPGYQFFPLKWKSAVDIDTYEDLAFAKVLYNLQNE